MIFKLNESATSLLMKVLLASPSNRHWTNLRSICLLSSEAENVCKKLLSSSFRLLYFLYIAKYFLPVNYHAFRRKKMVLKPEIHRSTYYGQIYKFCIDYFFFHFFIFIKCLPPKHTTTTTCQT